VRAPNLYRSLRCFCLAGFSLLADDVANGAELPFAFEEHASRGRASLYEYRPLVRSYVDARAERMAALADARLALVTTAALHVRGAPPFTGGHQGFRAIAGDTPLANIMLSHSSIGFDRSDVQRDLNVAFPLDRARELVAAGEIGSLASTHYAFLGAQRSYDGILQESGPAVARALRDDGVDAVLLTGV